jgi:hypothetical protein
MVRVRGREMKMPEHEGTREEWRAARDELARLEGEQAERNEEIKKKRLGLPWVRVEKGYEFETEEGRKTLAELFEGARSCWPTTSCSAPSTRWALARAAPAWRMGSRVRSSI